MCSSDLKIVKYLVGNGADVNAMGKYYETPLHTAAKNGKVKIVKYLVEKGADVNAVNELYETPLDYAAFNHKARIVKYLLGKGGHSKAKNFELFYSLCVVLIYMICMFFCVFFITKADSHT